MKQMNVIAVGLIAVLAFIGVFSVFTVDETELAIKFRLGEIVQSDFEPGLYFQFPIYNNIQKFDARIQTLDAEPELYLTSESKNVSVDAFIKWRIRRDKVANFYTATGGDSSRANIRLSQIIKDGLRGEFGKRTIQEVISGERNEIMDILTQQANRPAETFGIEIVDVRIKRIDLSKDISDSVYRRMEAERKRVANDYRARGEEAAEKIRADADRQRTIIHAEAYRDSEKIRGNGDGEASAIYAAAFGKDPKFYSLYRSLNAYKSTFADKGDMLIVEPEIGRASCRERV